MPEVSFEKLSGKALDWAVAKAVGQEFFIRDADPVTGFDADIYAVGNCPGDEALLWGPTEDWSQFGPLVSRFKVAFANMDRECTEWLAYAFFDGKTFDNAYKALGETHNVAGCRAIVRAVLGDVVIIPSEIASDLKA